jgi:hypothetical protein
MNSDLCPGTEKPDQTPDRMVVDRRARTEPPNRNFKQTLTETPAAIQIWRPEIVAVLVFEQLWLRPRDSAYERQTQQHLNFRRAAESAVSEAMVSSFAFGNVRRGA